MTIQIPPAYESLYEELCQTYRQLVDFFSQHSQWKEAEATLRDVLYMLERKLFTLVFVGGFNTGKSSLINVLLQPEVYKREEEKSEAEKGLQPLCLEGATPTTSQIHILRYGEVEDTTRLAEEVLLQTVPNRRLAELHLEIVDTPGTDSTNPLHDEITRGFIPKADLIFFLFSIDQPFTRTESEFLKLLSEYWQREILLLLNKIDTKRNLEGEIDWQAIETVVKDLQQKTAELLGRPLPVYPISVQLAKESIYQGRPELWKMSGLDRLEDYINDQIQRLLPHIKLKSSLETGRHLLQKAKEEMGEQQAEAQALTSAFCELEKQVRQFWNLGEEGRSRESPSHLFLERFDELLEGIRQRMDMIFTLPQLLSAFVRGGADRLSRDFQRELELLLSSFETKVEREFGALMDHFSREFLLLVREKELDIPLSDKRLEELEQELKSQFHHLFKGLQKAELQELLDSLVQRLMVSLGGWLAGLMVLFGALGALVSNPFSALLGGGLVGGGLIAGSTFWFQKKKREILELFREEIQKARENFLATLQERIQTQILEEYVNTRQRELQEVVKESQKVLQELDEQEHQLSALQKALLEMASAN